MGHIFISYSHLDGEYARRLARAIEERGLSPWIDDRIDYGTQWPHVVQEHLDACSAFVVIMTPRSYTSEWVQNELGRAKRKRKPIFPLLLEGDDLWLSVEATQYLDVRAGKLPPPRFYEQLVDAVAGEPAIPALEKRESSADRLPQRRTVGGIEFVRVPKGSFVMGSKDDNPLASDSEKPQHTLEIPYDYWIAHYPLTNYRFAEFVKAVKREIKLAGDWKQKHDHPVVNVSWHDAVAYCKWQNAKLRDEVGELEIRLPTEAEWEKAARGEYGNEWPWGNEFDAVRCNTFEGGKGGTTPVGAYSLQGDSPYGAADMVGNVWEWCHSLFEPYPYDAKDGREGESASGDRVLRGGSFYNDLAFARAASRVGNYPDFRNDFVGVRVVVAPRLS